MNISKTKLAQRLISADSHLTITNDRFLAHVPQKFTDVVSQLVTQIQAGMATTFQKKDGPTHAADGREGAHDPVERLKDQDIDGVEAEVLYSQSAFGFDGGLFYKLDADARRACFQAYNDSLSDWIEAAPRRLLPVGLIPVADVDEGVTEVERLVGLGFRALTIPTYPDVLRLDPYWDKKYEPLWRCLAEHRIPLSLHTTSTKGLWALQKLDPTPAKGIFLSLPPIYMAELISTWILGGMLPENPDLHIVLVEAGIGWIAYYLERLDSMFRRHNWARRGMIQELPSTYWYRQGHATFEDDAVGMRTLDLVGVDNVMWASDYPHSDSTWPESQKIVQELFHNVADEDKAKITWRNATELYRID